MKISLETNKINTRNNINFGAYKASINKNGEKEHNFYTPYNPNEYEAKLEIYEAKKENGIWHADTQKPIATIPMEKEGIAINDNDLKNSPYLHLAYRYRLINKSNPNDVRYITDNGTKTGEKGAQNIATVLYSDRNVIERPQNAILIMPDMFHSSKKDIDGKVTEGIEKNTLRNHGNMLGGNIQGIIAKLPELKEAGYTRIVGTPFTKDDVTSHKYWTQNAYQIASSLGTLEDFKELQKNLAENGMSWIADGAFVNEGLSGVHFASILKWGEQSPFRNWFYLGNSSEPITIGLFTEKNAPFVNFKLVNSPFILTQDSETKEIKTAKNEDYDGSKPTYVQFYDKRLIKKGDEHPSYLIRNYANTNEENTEITNYEDTISPYYFEINPDIIKNNIAKRNAVAKAEKQNARWDLQNVDTMKSILEFENFRFDDQNKAGGYVSWDGNIDIPKINLHVSNSDRQTYREDIRAREIGVLHARDYVTNAGKYWTALARDTQIQHIAKNIGKNSNIYSRINTLVQEKKLPQSILTQIDAETIKNITSNDYELTHAPMGEKRKVIQKAMEELPLDALNFSNELMASFSSPYITKRPFSGNDKNLTRADIKAQNYQNIPAEYRETYKKFDEVFQKDLANLIESIIDTANKYCNGLLYTEDKTKVTPLGAEIIKMLVPQITKEAIELSLVLNTVDNQDDENLYPKTLISQAQDITPQKLGINAYSPQQEASIVIDRLRTGIKTLADDNKSKKLKDYFSSQLATMAEKTTIDSINVAKVIVDRGETGLGWRIDAAKDVSNIDDLREGNGRFDDAWTNVIKIWKEFTQAVRRENPNAYITAEVTDLDNFLGTESLQKNILHQQNFKDESQAELAFLEETGITSFANYKYFYSAIKDMFTASSESGKREEASARDIFQNKFIEAWLGTRNILDHGPYDAVKGAYNFYENHDKPRILHTTALNMPLFLGSFIEGNLIEENRNVARNVLKYMEKTPTQTDFQTLNPKAIAMADRINKALNTTFNVEEKASDEELYGKNPKKVEFIKAFKRANAQLASGQYKDKTFNPEAYGVRPFEINLNHIFEQMKHNGYQLKEDEQQELKKQILTQILTPTCDDAYRIYRTMSVLPGMLTDFAGHKQGASGFETASKNIYQQNRNRINFEWTNEKFALENIPTIKEFEEKMNAVLEMRNQPEFSALTNGDTIILPKDEPYKEIASIFRYDDTGSKVVALVNGASSDYHLDHILLQNGNGEGLPAGLEEGLTFRNEDSSDLSEYRVERFQDSKDFHIARYDEHGNKKPLEILQTAGNVLILYCVGKVTQTKKLLPDNLPEAFNFFKKASKGLNRII